MKTTASYPKIIIHRLGNPPVMQRRIVPPPLLAGLLVLVMIAAGAALGRRHASMSPAWQVSLAR